MDAKRRNHRDFLQNIIISLLSLSAVILIAQTQIYSLGDSSEYFQQFLGGDSAEANTAVQSVSLSSPLRAAVSGTYGRYGDVDLVTSDESFRQLGSLLGEALGSAQQSISCSQESFAAALNRPSIYYDFLNPQPLSILATELGAEVTSDTFVRSLLLSDNGANSIQLYFWDGADSFQVCATALTPSDLDALIGQYEQGNAFFASDRAALDETFAALAPWSLFLQTTPELPVLSAQPMQTDTDALLTALHFNPRTNYRYPDSSGAEVIVEGDRSVHIRPDGTVFYRSGSEATLTIDVADPDAPTIAEAVSETSALVSELLSDTGEASFYLESVAQTGTSMVLRYGYQINGTPIRFADGGTAVEITLTGSVISSLSLRLRTYTATSELSLLLPLPQALTIAAQHPGAELSIGYTDSGASSVSACWLSD